MKVKKSIFNSMIVRHVPLRASLVLLFLLCSASLLLAQTTVSGLVTDSDGKPVSGVSVRMKNTQTASISDADGRYMLSVPNLNGTLVFSHVGYQEAEVAIGNSGTVNTALIAIDRALDEVVITGYSTQQKRDITGSVAVVNMEAVENQPAISLDKSLQGMASGVNVTSSGVPGSASKINIRGLTSFGDTQPLVIVDGIEQNITHINPNDVESIQVLKDAGAAAIYGVRGANGIIIISTKKGKTGKPTIEYEGSFNVNYPLSGNVFDIMNSTDFMNVYNQAFPGNPLFSQGMPDYTYRGPNGAGIGFEGDPAVNPDLYFYEKKNVGKNYIIQKVNKDREDWFHNIFSRSFSSQYAVSVNGGTENSKYYFGLGHVDQNGTLYKSFYKRYNGRVNTEFRIADRIRVGENLTVLYRTRSGGGNSISTAYTMLPIVPLRDIAGNWAGSFGGPSLGSFSNTVANQDRNANDLYYNWGIAGNAYLEADIVTGLTFRTSLGLNYGNRYERDFSGTQTENVEASGGDNSLRVGSGYNSTLTFTNTVNYSKIFDQHNVQLLVGTEAIKDIDRDVNGSSVAFFSEDENYLEVDNGTLNINANSSAYSTSLFSLFGRANYSYADKYLGSFTIRRDGSSKFGSKKRYGVFPSFSLGWRISEESFLRDAGWLNDLKLRGSWGVLGSQNNVDAANAYSLYSSSISGTYYDISGTASSVVQGFGQSRIGNMATGWEQNVLTNFGVDMQFLNKFTLAVEYYKKEINGLLFSEPLSAVVLGGASAPTINIGDIQNTGIDASVNYSDRLSSDFQFNVGVNFTTYTNKVVDLPNPGYFLNGSHEALGTLTRNEEGKAMSSFYGYKIVSIFNSQEEVDAAPTQTAAEPGRFRYQDMNGDGRITADDRTILGNPNPDFTYGINLGFNYKNFDLSTLLYGSQGNDIMNTTLTFLDFMSYYQGAKSNRLKNAWTPENTNTTVPKIETTRSFSTVGASNSYFVEDGSYLKLRHITLGYTFSPEQLAKLGISRIRLYTQATNLFTITKYSGLDPEISSGSPALFGIDGGAYPNNEAGVFFGINASF